jgi:hypothetical protein
MAIIKCPKCAYTVSDRAPACPKCKLPLRDALGPSASGAAAIPIDSSATPAPPLPTARIYAPIPRAAPEPEASTKKGLFSRIESRADALKLAKDASTGFFVLAALQGLIGFFLMKGMLADAILFAILAAGVRKWHSRFAAVLLFMASAAGFVVTVLNRAGVTSLGGKNIFLGVFMLILAARAVEATFKLHGRFSE